MMGVGMAAVMTVPDDLGRMAWRKGEATKRMMDPGERHQVIVEKLVGVEDELLARCELDGGWFMLVNVRCLEAVVQ